MEFNILSYRTRNNRYNGVTSLDPIRYFDGLAALDSDTPPYNANRFGDYSYTSLDPDGLTFWTIQEYAEAQYVNTFQSAWGTRIGAISQKQ